MLEDEYLDDGATVTVLIPDQTFDLAPEEKAELLERLREADIDPGIDAFELLRDIARKNT